MDSSPTPKVFTRAEWLEARKALLAREKELTYAREALAAARRALPRVAIEKDYTFDTETGRARLVDLFDGRSQLIVYHFMFPESWQAGRKSCSFWADSYDGIQAHLTARDVSLVAISISPLAKLLAFRARMGWSFPWASSAGSSFFLRATRAGSTG